MGQDCRANLTVGRIESVTKSLPGRPGGGGADLHEGAAGNPARFVAGGMSSHPIGDHRKEPRAGFVGRENLGRPRVLLT